MAKVRFGLRNIYIAPITEEDNEITYGTPFALPGAVNLSLSPSGEETVFWADDSRYYVVSANAGYSGTMEIAMLTDKFSIDILGYIKDTNGLIVESKDNKPKAFAMMYEVQDDESASRYVFYNVTVGRAETNAQTTSENAEVQTATLNITCSAAKDTGYVKAYTSGDTPDATYNAWFTAVPEVSISA